MSDARRILMVEDSPDDAELSIRALRRAGIDLTFQRVETPETMRKALAEGTWDLVIADYSMPRFNGLAALKMLRETGSTCRSSWSRGRWARMWPLRR